jgi:putative tricarboxylic transport membrane protein
MGVFGDLLGGFATALSPEYLLLSALGVTLGTAVGVLPGIGPALSIALLLPVTLDSDPTGAFVMIAGIYYGVPGESSSVATTLEGFPMAVAPL